MSENTYSLQYWIRGGKDESYPTSPIVNICLKTWSTKKDIPPIISPDLMTEGEIDHHVNKLQSELETIRVEAKKALRSRLPN